MRNGLHTAALALALTIAVTILPAHAELQNVQIGGQISIRHRHFSDTRQRPRVDRIPPAYLPKRPIGPFGTFSAFSFDKRTPKIDFTELDTRITVRADFTSDVVAMIGLNSFDIWGQDFRSDYVTGADFAGTTSDDVTVYLSYIEANNFLIDNLRLRVGRQQLHFEDGFLISKNSSSTRPLFFDAVRLTYETDLYSFDGFYSILAEDSGAEEDGDVTLAGLHASYFGLESTQFDAFYYLIRDPRSINDTAFAAPIEWVENLFGLDDYDPAYLNTVGMHVGGDMAGFDYDAYVAYQFGKAHSIGSRFIPNGGIYGDNDAGFGAWGGDAEVGYSIDVAWSPRIFLGGAYYGGEDNRDLNFRDWLNPFYRSKASVSFNRLFSSWTYTNAIDAAKNMSNFWAIRGGVTVKPTGKLAVTGTVHKFYAIGSFRRPLSIGLGDWAVPVAPNLAFLTEKSDDDLGWVTVLGLKYMYSEDLEFRASWEHLFTGKGIAQGQFIRENGLRYSGGSRDDDGDYYSARMVVKF